METWTYLPPEAAGGAGRIAPDGEALSGEGLQRFALSGFGGETLRFAVQSPANAAKADDAPHAGDAAQISEDANKGDAAQSPNEAEKPWISHEPPAPEAMREHLSPLEQAMAAQCGLNPRRNRSLQEIIEEKWRHSRIEQLGHPVPARAMGRPVEDPLQRAIQTLQETWRIPELRNPLVDAMAELAEFSAALNGRVRRQAEGALRRELEDLEAERLKSLDDLDRLKREKHALREQFKQEIREEEADALREAVERTHIAQEECARQETAAAEARRAADCARDAFAALSDGRFEDKLMDFAITSRAAELIAKGMPAMESVRAAEVAPDRAEWIARAQRAFAAEGLEIGEIQAANLLVCAALSDSILLSGSAASDKDTVARAMARALGALDAKRYAELSESRLPESWNLASDLPAVALVRNANGAMNATIDRGLCGAAKNLIVISTLADGGAGYPVSAEALERGFLIRVEPESAQSPWKRALPAAGTFPPATLSALRDSFRAHAAEIPVALERRFQRIRDALSKHGVRLSRRTLDMMWNYCAAMLALRKISAGEVLDLAFAQKALPCILAEAPLECLMELEKILSGMPHSLSLLRAPLPIHI